MQQILSFFKYYEYYIIKDSREKGTNDIEKIFIQVENRNIRKKLSVICIEKKNHKSPQSENNALLTAFPRNLNQIDVKPRE